MTVFVAPGDGGWAGEQWWYKLAHVFRRWRNFILGSASYLGLCLYCTKCMPTADTLADFPPLPLVIEHHYEYSDIAAEDEEAQSRPPHSPSDGYSKSTEVHHGHR